MRTVFLSWQSDIGETRNVIQSALEKAVRNLNRDCSVEMRVDQDTAGVSGWPEITSAILDKIDKCEVFVADITPINGPYSNFRLTPNPNVMLELGYALASGLGRIRIICIVNTAYLPDEDIKELPFDVRGSRPVVFSLADPDDRGVEKGQEDPHRTKVRDDVSRRLERDLQDTLDAIQTAEAQKILSVTPHLANDNLERFQVVFDVQTPMPFQVYHRVQEPEPHSKILSALMTSHHPVDPKGESRIRFPVTTLKPLSPSNDVYVLYGELGHLPSELNLVPTMHKFEVHYRVVGDQLVEIFRQQAPAH